MSGDDTEPARREAARWYAELQDEAAGPEVWHRFLVWERQPGNAAAFRQIEAALSTLDRVRFAGTPEKKTSLARWPMAAGLAAAVLLAALGSIRLMGDGEPAAPVPEPLIYATAVGEQESVTLEDGSLALLNTASRMEVVYSHGERRITLMEGQALFDVQREARPFIVAAGGAETRALGTRFEVYLPTEALQVTLLEGLVSIAGEGVSRIILSPGEQMMFRDGEVTVARIDPARALSWQNGMVPFTDVTLAEAVSELNRYSEVKLRVDEALAAERLSGSFRAGDQEGFVSVLEAFLPVRAERRAGEILIRRAETAD